MTKSLCLLATFLLAGLLLGACRQALVPSPEVNPTAGGATKPAATEAPTQKWNNALSRAKEEGKVTVYNTLWGAETRQALSDGFARKYGLEVEFVPFARGAEMIAKVQAQKTAGLNMADIYGIGNTTLLVSMKPEGLLGSIEPMLVLPEVLDTRVWRENKIPFTDAESMTISMLGKVYRSVIYNTDLVKQADIASYKDLLKPQFKGMITMNDPSVTGAGNTVLAHLGNNLWGDDETGQFFRRLIKEQKLVIERDNRIHVESVARGKYAVAIGPSGEVAAKFISLGAPVKMADVVEDNRLSTGAGAMGVPAKFAHPDAAVVFVNWLLTKEGQSALATSSGNPSRRLDASTEGIDPIFIPSPDKKYFETDTPEGTKANGRWLDLSRKIMEEPN